MAAEGYKLFLPHNICRCCGNKKTSVINLQNTGLDRVDKILRIISLLPKRILNISPTDKLSKLICIDCEMSLLHFGEFCEMIKKAQQHLKSAIPTTKERKPVSNMNNKTLMSNLKNKIDCHVSGVSSSGSPVVISVAGDGNIKCEDCQRSLVMSELMTLNMLTHGLGTVLCACLHCSHRDDISSFLHHNNSLVNCPKCMFVDFQSPLSSTVSVQSKVSDGKYKCEVCNAQFQKIYRYNRHKLIHLGVKPFLCETCGMKFNQKNSLKLHMMKHDKKNPHLCQWCGQSFRFKVSLQSHMLNTHGSLPESAKKFECDHCKKQFATIYKLQRHYRLHTGDRPYECSICNKWFTQSGNLQNHMKKHKTDSFETFSTDELLDNENEILETILDSCTKGEEFMSMEQQAQPNFSLVGDGNVDKHNPTDLFSDFNPQDVLFDNTPILDSSNANSPIILPNFSSLQGGSPDINL